MSTIRFSGMASGMDTESMVKQLMDAEKLRLNKYNQQKQIKTWTQEAYNDTNKDLANFILDTKKELGVGIGGSVSSASWIKKATASNTSVVDATGSSSAISGTHTINVDKLAVGINAASESSVTDNTLENLLDGAGFDASGNYTIQINGGTSGGGADVVLSKTDKLADVAKKISNAVDINGKSLGIKASYDSTAERFFMSTTETGGSTKININESGDGAATPKFLFKNDGSDTSILKLKINYRDGANDDKNEGFKLNTEYTGGDAIIDFDGAGNITYPSNHFTINGISVTAKAEGTSTIQVDTDVDGVYDKIKGFVDKYNELLDKLNKKTSEKRYRDYQPLTDEQKKAMDEDTVKMWEGKAKSGLLRGDDHIDRMIGATRSGLYESVYSDYKADTDKTNDTKLSGFSFISEIGITTGNYKDKGKLEIDEDKLKKAITNDVDGVMNLLFKSPDPTTTDKTEKRKETGLINRIYDNIIDGMKNIIDKSGTGENASLYRKVKQTILIDFVTKSSSISLLDKDVVNLEKQISKENSRLSSVENRYWRQFTAMEKAMNKMNSQSSWLASQMGGM